MAREKSIMEMIDKMGGKSNREKSIMEMIYEMGGKGKSHVRKSLTKKEREKILIRQKGKCKNFIKCKVVFYVKGVLPHFDHIKPVGKSGEKGRDLKNIQALCPNCHDIKSREEHKKHKNVKKKPHPHKPWGPYPIKTPRFGNKFY